MVVVWRVYMEGCKSIKIVTNYTTLRHLPKSNDAEKLAKIPRRYFSWLYVLSPYFDINPETNKPILTILYRKGCDDDANASSRRPDLQLQLEHDMCTT